jgi:chromosome segregation ATPase
MDVAAWQARRRDHEKNYDDAFERLVVDARQATTANRRLIQRCTALRSEYVREIRYGTKVTLLYVDGVGHKRHLTEELDKTISDTILLHRLITTLQRDRSDLQRDKTDLQREKLELQREKLELQRDKTELQHNSMDLQRINAVLQYDNTDLQCEKSALQRNIDEVQAQLTEAEQKTTRALGSLGGFICCVCKTTTMNVCLLPCRHARYCSECIDALSTPKICPLCRATIKEVIPLFL